MGIGTTDGAMADQPTPDERRFRALANSSVEHVTEVDEQGRILYASPDSRPGYDAGSLGFDRVLDEDRAEVAAQLARAFRDGTTQRVAFRVTFASGEMQWLEATITPFEAENDARHALIVCRDVTESREMEARLRETRERFHRVAENAYDMISEHDVDGRLLYCNDRVWDVLGYGADHQLTPVELVHPDDQDRLVKAFRRVRDGVETSCQEVHRVERADGTWCWVESTICASGKVDGQCRPLIIARDVTGRVEADRRLRESEIRYRELIEKAPVGIAVIQGEEFVFANAAAAAMCGAATPEELVGTNLLRMLPVSDMREVLQSVDRAQRADRPPEAFDVVLEGLDDRERHLLGVGTFASYLGQPAFQAIMRDVTELEQSRRDQERLTLQLQEARKLESLGVLAGGIAHDFNNLLAVVLSNVRYAKAEDASREDRTEALADAEEATENAARLVRQLLDYAGRREPEVRSVDVSELTRSMTELLATAMSSAVELRVELAPEPLPVHADVVQLEQVLMNLVLNAADAVGDTSGRVTVRTSLVELDEDTLATWLGGEHGAGLYACLEVEDTGSGMDEETRIRIFEPFFTTKQNGHGLGLSAVLGLVQGHRGAIEVTSEPGRGTRFRVALPADAGVRTRPRPRSPLVLVVEPHTERPATAALCDSGLDALDAKDLVQATDLWKRHGEEFSAAVVDLRTEDAPSLLDTLRTDRPELPILALAPSDREGEDRLEGRATFVLSAPFTSEELCARMADLLQKADQDA